MSDKTIARCLILIMLIAIFDSISTYVLISGHGFGETNPVLYWLLDLKNPYTFFVIKLGVTALVLWYLWNARSARLAQITIIICLILYIPILIWYLYCFFNIIIQIWPTKGINI